MTMNIKPKAQIGEIVNIVGCDFIQTSYGLNIVHLAAKHNNNKINYYIRDIKVTISLKTGEIEYNYLISTSKELNNKFNLKGWVRESNIEPVREKVTV